MPREQLPGKVTGLAASWQLLGSTCSLVGQRRLQRAGKAVGALDGEVRTLFLAGSVCTPAIAAAKAPAKGCPPPCGTRARGKPSQGPAGADPPQPRLLWGTDCTVAPCRGAGLGLPWTKCPEGPKAPTVERIEAQGPAEPGRGSRSPAASPGRRPLARLSAGPRAQGAPGTGRRRHLPGGGEDCAGPAPLVPTHSRARRARGRGRLQQRRLRGAAGAAGCVLLRTQQCTDMEGKKPAVLPSKKPGGQLSCQAVAWPSGLRRWI